MEKKPDILLWISSFVYIAAAGVRFFGGHPATAAAFLVMAVVLFPPAAASSVYVLGETASILLRGVLFFGSLLVLVVLTMQPGEPETTTAPGDLRSVNIIYTMAERTGCTPLAVEWTVIDSGDTGRRSFPPGPAVKITYLKRDTACTERTDRKAMELLRRLAFYPAFSDVTTFILLPKVTVTGKNDTEALKPAGEIVFSRSGGALIDTVIR